jgi:hypothetical protein
LIKLLGWTWAESDRPIDRITKAVIILWNFMKSPNNITYRDNIALIPPGGENNFVGRNQLIGVLRRRENGGQKKRPPEIGGREGYYQLELTSFP